jgi:hypothetical protein
MQEWRASAASSLNFMDDLQPIIHDYLDEVDQRLSRTNEDSLLARIVDQGGIAVYREDSEVFKQRWKLQQGAAEASPAGDGQLYPGVGPQAFFGSPPPSESIAWSIPPELDAQPEYTTPERFLQFSSAFESGNLKYAVYRPREHDAEPAPPGVDTYELVLDFDKYTAGHTQWFYFGVRGARKGQRVRFRIVNFCKAGSLYSKGMQPLVFSERAAGIAFACTQDPNAAAAPSGGGWAPMHTGFAPVAPEAQTSTRYVRNEHPRIATVYRHEQARPPVPRMDSGSPRIVHSDHEADQDANASDAEGDDGDAGSDDGSGGEDGSGEDDDGGDEAESCPETPDGVAEAQAAEEEKALFRHLLTKHKEAELSKKFYHSLEFEYTFEHDDDAVFFAYTFPYTYSMQRTYLTDLQKEPLKGRYLQRKPLCVELGGGESELLTITNPETPRRYKKVVVVSSRVHPGEANASWVCHGLIEFLLSSSPEAQVLRDRFIWKVIPMLNPDGVISGNYRCSLAGVDLNRQWRKPSHDLHRPIFETKALLKKILQGMRHGEAGPELALYVDLHGHSKKLGAFSYVCGPPSDDPRFWWVRMYPKLMSLISPHFSYRSCRWRVGRGKRGTARVVVSKDLGFPYAYTIETSFFGTKTEDGTVVPFTREAYEQLGASLAQGCLHFNKLQGDVQRERRRRATLLKSSCVSTPQPTPPLAPAWIDPPVSKRFDEADWEALIASSPTLLEQPWDDEVEEGCDGALDVEVVLDELQQEEYVSSYQEAESGGSDSCPSEDNLKGDELSKLSSRMRRVRKKRARRERRKAAKAKEAREKERKAQQVQKRAKERQDLVHSNSAPFLAQLGQKVVAFGRTTLLKDLKNLKSASSPSLRGSTLRSPSSDERLRALSLVRLSSPTRAPKSPTRKDRWTLDWAARSQVDRRLDPALGVPDVEWTYKEPVDLNRQVSGFLHTGASLTPDPTLGCLTTKDSLMESRREASRGLLSPLREHDDGRLGQRPRLMRTTSTRPLRFHRDLVRARRESGHDALLEEWELRGQERPRSTGAGAEKLLSNARLSGTSRRT